MDTEIKDYVTVDELAAQINVSRTTLKRMIAKGELPPFTYGCGITDRAQGWHREVLKRHALRKLESDVQVHEQMRTAGNVVEGQKPIILPANCEYLTAKQVSVKYGIPVGTLNSWRWFSRGGNLMGPKFIQIGPRTYRYKISDLEDYVHSNKLQEYRDRVEFRETCLRRNPEKSPSKNLGYKRHWNAHK